MNVSLVNLYTLVFKNKDKYQRVYDLLTNANCIIGGGGGVKTLYETAFIINRFPQKFVLYPQQYKFNSNSIFSYKDFV